MIVDADAHVTVPYEIFAERLDGIPTDRKPRPIHLDGREFWVIDGKLAPKLGGFGQGTPGGFGTRRIGAQDYYVDNVPGRLSDMDREGVQIQVLYPDLILVNPGIENPDVASAISRAWNDHLAERCAAAPDRLKRVAVVALQDPLQAAHELRRAVVELGCVGAVTPPLVGSRLLDHRDFEPFFEEADRLQAAIAIHGVTGVYEQPWQDLFDTWFGSRTVAVPISYMVAMTSLFQGHMLERYPHVRFGFFEAGGCGWVPYWTERLDDQIATRSKQDTPASEYIRQGRLFFSCEPDERGLPDVVARIGDGCILYASDYPHGDTKWPNTVSALRAIPGLEESAAERILGDNAGHFYRCLAD
ncbi:MAG TPA: amidohydrolase family protein [Chloroflexota bacterium]|nr:amidohydrolase family protein [Chloroflexota bacterium]